MKTIDRVLKAFIRRHPKMTEAQTSFVRLNLAELIDQFEIDQALLKVRNRSEGDNAGQTNQQGSMSAVTKDSTSIRR